ncbi:hypothetical protein QQF64_033313 [Cirrhinus molitorella]|uniref:Beta/gamma crystallin 'Greek key' domain-containing protein n=1 Tax=Cirrhinus molitorella TaxID=172907 RepID=A0ABR3MTI1_9TELE
MGKIIFYEDRNFQGRSYECSSDCSDMSTYLSRCHSCRVESGCFVVYDRPNYMGNQFFMRRGEYADGMRMGMSDGIRSCRMVPQYRGPYRMRIYERENFGGQMYELTDDCDSFMDHYRMSDCQSCHVMDGHWLMYEQPHYRGRMIYFRPGEYRNFRDMGYSNIIFYEDRNFHGRNYETSGDCPEVTSYLSRCSSCRVESGCFMVYERSNFTGHQMLVRRGEYPDNQQIMGASISDCIRSCKMIPMHKGTFRMRIFERENFVGQKYELMDDCESVQERFHMPDCQSCNVTHGHWLLYEQPNFEGRMIYIRPGEYSSFNNMGLGPVKICSIRRIMESC